jgi:hypothetical protein
MTVSKAQYPMQSIEASLPKAGRGGLGGLSSPAFPRVRLLVVLFFALCFSFSLAQSKEIETAKQAVQEWQAGKYAVDPGQALGKPTEEAVRTLERYIAFPPPPQGLEVNLESPLEEQSTRGNVVSFPASVGEQTGEVRVLVQNGQPTRISWVPAGGQLPPWIESPVAWGLFVLVSLGWVLALRGGGILAQWWREGWALVRSHARLYLTLNALLYGLFILGSLTAYTSPEMASLVQRLVGGALEQIGLGEGEVRGGVLEFALLIFYWNFTRGLVLTTAMPGLLLGVPALLINAFRYFLFGFALSPALFPTAAFVAHVPTLLIELQAYILGTFGGMVLAGRVLRGEGFRPGLRAVGLMVYLGGFFLLLGAWYEALEIVVLLGR